MFNFVFSVHFEYLLLFIFDILDFLLVNFDHLFYWLIAFVKHLHVLLEVALLRLWDLYFWKLKWDLRRTLLFLGLKITNKVTFRILFGVLKPHLFCWRGDRCIAQQTVLEKWVLYHIKPRQDWVLFVLKRFVFSLGLQRLLFHGVEISLDVSIIWGFLCKLWWTDDVVLTNGRHYSVG